MEKLPWLIRLFQGNRWQPFLLAAICYPLALRGFQQFLASGSTAFEWPALDMALYFERAADPDFLRGDFFTEASAAPNPRHVFGKLVLSSGALLGWGWYQVLFGMKLLCALAFPPLYFLTTWRLTADRFRSWQGSLVAICVAVLGIVLIVSTRLGEYLSVAWFKPYKVDATPQSLSLLIGMTGVILVAESGAVLFAAGLGLLALSCLIHPAIGIFLAAVVILSRVGITSRPRLAMVGMTAFLAGMAVSLMFPPDLKINAAEFVRTYVVERHPSHYLPSAFGTLTSWPWYRSFTVVTMCMILPLVYFARRRDLARFAPAALFTAAYTGSLAAQWFFVVVFPVKQVAVLGPIRFTIFGYLMVVMGWSMMLADAADAMSGRWVFSVPVGRQARPFPVWPVTGLVLAAVVLVTSILSPVLIDDPESRVTRHYGGLFKWIASTPEKSTFAVYPGYLNLFLPVFTRRPVYANNGFPFREDFFAEYTDRYARLYGSAAQLKEISGSWTGARSAAFYRSRTPADFMEASRKHRLDFVIMEKDHAGRFAGLRPVYQDERVLIYPLGGQEAFR
ncbi:MAG: hypothetical protein RRA32_01270 [bacterium]|nr:hypothetical protein [bacterium]